MRLKTRLLSKYLPNRAGTLTSLVYATIVAAGSLLVLPLFYSNRLIWGLVISYVPIFLGALSMWFCVQASGKAKHKTAVFVYALLLAPFALYYPYGYALMIFANASIDADHRLITRDGSTARLVEDSPTIRDLLTAQAMRDEQAARERAEKLQVLSEKLRVWSENSKNKPGAAGSMPSLQDLAHQDSAFGHEELLETMTRAPALTIPKKTYARRLETSGAKCTPEQLASAEYIKIRITSGPYRGREGWICEVDVSRTVMMP